MRPWTSARGLGRGLAAGLATALVATPPAALARSGPEVQAATPDAQKLYVEAGDLADAGDHGGAIERYLVALDLLEESEQTHAMRANFIAGLVYSTTELYRSDAAPEGLRRTKQRLERYVRELSSVHGTTASELSGYGLAREGIDEIDAELARLAPPPAAAEPTPADPEPEPELQPAPRVPTATPPPTDVPPRSTSGRALVIGGGVSIALSLGATALMAVGLVRGARAEQDGQDRVDETDGMITKEELQPITTRGENANIMAIAGGVAAGALLVTGVSLVVIGAGKMRRDKNSRRAHVVPTVSGVRIVF